MRRIINQWNLESSVEDKKSMSRHTSITKVTNGELSALDKLIYKHRDLSASAAKLRLQSARTVQKYLNRLGGR